MRLLLLLFFIPCSIPVFAQITVAIPEYSFLYRGYDNRLVISACGMDGAIILESDDALINKLADTYYIVRTSTTSKTIELHARNVITNTIISSFTYRVLNMPLPAVYWGDFPEGSKIPLMKNELKIRYDDGIPLNDSFSILEYEISAGGFKQTFSGSVLTEELIQTLKNEKLAKGDQNLDVSLMIVYSSPDRVSRRKIATFTF